MQPDNTYYLNLLSIEEGDLIEWIVGAGGELQPHQGHKQRGTVMRAYPNGHGQYATPIHAFFVVNSEDNGLRYSVPYDNPTIRKLETTP